MSADDLDDDDERTQTWTGIDTDRLRAYTEALHVIGDILWPARAGDDVLPRRRPRIDTKLRGDLELALTAIARDIRRLTVYTGPYTHREEE